MLLIETVVIVISMLLAIVAIIVSVKFECDNKPGVYRKSNITTFHCNGPYRTSDDSNLIPDVLEPKSLSLVEMLMLGKWRRKYSDGETYFVLGRPAKFTLSQVSLSIRTGIFRWTRLDVEYFEQHDLWEHCCKGRYRQAIEQDKKLKEKAKRIAKKLVQR